MMTLEQLDTPALIVDMDLVDVNLQRLFGALARTHVTVRPHLKTVKSPFFARLMLNFGAKGVCVAKLSEAEVMVGAGITDILITSEIAGAPKVVRLLKLLAD
jgi:D-serine deaminase-like pyridoxal phosphate-dependent protein